ncbi:MAG TPA: hypothetical protein VE867_01510, partial [Candidatus Binatia bacterium]|nr:hypothetical protein [Candidatus Binatia bacterium]
WANGGLVILPKLFRYLKTNSTLSEAVLRTQYLISTSLGNLAVLALMVYPFGGLYSPRTSLFAPESKWLLASNLSYLILYRRDLLLSNYKFTDFARILALNLLLIPVNLGGVAKSLHQCWTGQPPIFGRTPKVPGRTAAPPVYILTNMAIVTFLLGVAGFRVYNSLGDAAVFPLLSAVALGYALFRLVGIRHAWEDVVAGVALRAKRIGAAIRIRPVPVF